MACTNCKCKEIKFSCSNPPVVQVDEVCVFPEAMSVELSFGSRSDCHFYYTNCLQNQIGDFYHGIIDCYDRQKILDDLVNGTYILSRGPDENLFSYSYIGPDNIDVLTRSCFTPSTLQYNQKITINVTAVQTPRNLTTGKPPILGFDSFGNTAYMTISFPGRHTLQSTYPTYLGGQAGQDRYIFSYSVTYACNQPITCDGGLSFTYIQGFAQINIFFGPEVLGRNGQYTIFPTALALTPVL